MSQLKAFYQDDPRASFAESSDPALIASLLDEAGVRFERWETNAAISAGDDPENILAAYKKDIDRIVSEGGYQTVDVISLDASHPDKDALRAKFLDEHTHSEDEVRFFVAGRGLFALHIGDKVFEVLCEEGDLISVPANTPHWFDMGEEPELVAIRFFNNPEGWVANYTGSTIAGEFSRLE